MTSGNSTLKRSHSFPSAGFMHKLNSNAKSASITAEKSWHSSSADRIDNKLSSKSAEENNEKLISQKIEELSIRLAKEMKLQQEDDQKELAYTMKHVLAESIDGLLFALQAARQVKLKEQQFKNNQAKDYLLSKNQLEKEALPSKRKQDQAKDSERFLIVHYKNTFPELATAIMKESKQLNIEVKGEKITFMPDHVVHIRNIEKLKKLNYISKKIAKEAELSKKLKHSIVYIPICTGANEALSGEQLKETIQTYLDFGADHVYVYLGRYDDDDKPESKRAQEGATKRAIWLANNKRYIPDAPKTPLHGSVSVITRQELISQNDFKISEIVVRKLFLELKDESGLYSIQKLMYDNARTRFVRINRRDQKAMQRQNATASIRQQPQNTLFSTSFREEQETETNDEQRNVVSNIENKAHVLSSDLSFPPNFVPLTGPTQSRYQQQIMPQSKSAPASICGSPPKEMMNIPSPIEVAIGVLAEKALESKDEKVHTEFIKILMQLQKNCVGGGHHVFPSSYRNRMFSSSNGSHSKVDADAERAFSLSTSLNDVVQHRS